jgi:colanic acid/amylovoran biosynthesis glycosyltransferase
MPRVLIFKETLLPASETFIVAQIDALKRYQALLCGLERCRPSLSLDLDQLVLDEHPGVFGALRAKLYRKTGIAPLFHGRARRFRPDLIHAHFASGGCSAISLSRSLRVPLIVTLHGADVTVRGSNSTRYHELAKQAALFICVSEFIRNRALELDFPAAKLIVHYIGIDRILFAPSVTTAKASGVLFVGRLVEKKGCEYLLRAMRLVQNDAVDSELTVIGDGPLRFILESLARKLQIRCRFLGVQSSGTVREMLQTSRVFCVPSITAADGDSEGLGLVFAEAQSMGVPVVSTWHGGIPEVVSAGKTGLLVPERDHEALADALLAVLTDDRLWERLSRASHADIAERFDLTTQTAILEIIYDRVIGSG